MNLASSPILLRIRFGTSSAHGRSTSRLSFFERDLDLPLVEEQETAKLFPKSQSAREVRDKLLAFARHKGAAVVTDTLVTDVWRSANGWTVDRQEGDPIEADAVILATGGLSVPNTGSDGRGLQIAERLGHVVHRTYAALTPLTVRTTSPFAHLSGVSLPVTITARVQRAEGDRHRADFSSHIAATAARRCSTCRTSRSARSWSSRHPPRSRSNGRRWAKLSGVPPFSRADRERCWRRSARRCLSGLPRRWSSTHASIPDSLCRNSIEQIACG